MQVQEKLFYQALVKQTSLEFEISSRHSLHCVDFMLLDLGLKAVQGVVQITMRRNKSVMFTIDRPDIYKNPGSETYIIFGEAKVSAFGFFAM